MSLFVFINFLRVIISEHMKALRVFTPIKLVWEAFIVRKTSRIKYCGSLYSQKFGEDVGTE